MLSITGLPDYHCLVNKVDDKVRYCCETTYYCEFCNPQKSPEIRAKTYDDKTFLHHQ